MYSERPLGVSRSPMISARSGLARNWLTISASQSTARSRGLVGFSVASLYAYSGNFLRRPPSTSCAEYDGTDCGRKLYFICVSRSGRIWPEV